MPKPVLPAPKWVLHPSTKMPFGGVLHILASSSCVSFLQAVAFPGWKTLTTICSGEVVIGHALPGLQSYRVVRDGSQSSSTWEENWFFFINWRFLFKYNLFDVTLPHVPFFVLLLTFNFHLEYSKMWFGQYLLESSMHTHQSVKTVRLSFVFFSCVIWRQPGLVEKPSDGRFIL